LVNRAKLIIAMREREVREELVIRAKEMLKETVNKMRLNGKTGECFWTKIGLRQGGPLRPIFSIYWQM
jgi:hypothetical protein